MTAQATDGEPELPGGRSRDSVSGPDHAVNPLQRLIQQRLRERNWSYGEVARRGGLPRSTVYTLATTRNLVRPPRPVTIDALARGLDVPVSVDSAAAARTAETGTSSPRASASIVAGRGGRTRFRVVARV